MLLDNQQPHRISSGEVCWEGPFFFAFFPAHYCRGVGVHFTLVGDIISSLSTVRDVLRF